MEGPKYRTCHAGSKPVRHRASFPLPGDLSFLIVMSESDPPKSPKNADLSTALALTERLLNPHAEDGSDPPAPPERLGQNMRYWMWRMGGRKRPEIQDVAHISKLFDNYDIELERQQKAHQDELERRDKAHQLALQKAREATGLDIERIRDEIKRDADRSLLELQRELSQARERTSKLEHANTQLQRAYDTDVAQARSEIAALTDGPLQRAESRAAELEMRLAVQHSDQQRALEAARAAHEAAQAQIEENAARSIAKIRTEAAQAKSAAEALVAEVMAESARKQAEGEARVEALTQRLAQAALAHRTESDAARQLAEARLDAAAHHSAQLQTQIDELIETHAQSLAALREAKEREISALKAEFDQASQADALHRRNEQDRRISELREAQARELRTLADSHSEEIVRLRREMTADSQEAQQQAQHRIAELELARDTLAANADVSLARVLEQLTQAQAEKHQLDISLKQSQDSHLRELAALAQHHQQEQEDSAPKLQSALDRIAELEAMLRAQAEQHAEAIGQVRTEAGAKRAALHAELAAAQDEIQGERQRQEDLKAAHAAELAELAQRSAEAPEPSDIGATPDIDATLRQTQDQLAAAVEARRTLETRLAQSQQATVRKLQDQAGHHAEYLKRELAKAAAEAQARLQQAEERIAELSAAGAATTAHDEDALRQAQARLSDALAENRRIADRHAAEISRLTAEIAAARAAGEDSAKAGLRQALDRLAIVQAERRDLAERLEQARSQPAPTSAAVESATARITELEAELARLRMVHAREMAEQAERGSRAATAAEARIAVLAEELTRQRDANAAAPPAAIDESLARLAINQRMEIERLQREADRERGELDGRLTSATGRIADLEADLVRLRLVHGRDQERQTADHAEALQRLRLELERATNAEKDRRERDLATARTRIAELEARLNAPPVRTGNGDTDPRLNAALARAMMAEDELRIANNKLELLKDALDAAKARAVSPGPGPVDTRFRDVKRSFARHFHPDQGGKGDPDKERIFLEFWPVLEKIDRASEF
jgi:hypothetical protein